jgi:hypothetical protein
MTPPVKNDCFLFFARLIPQQFTTGKQHPDIGESPMAGNFKQTYL